MRRWRLSSGEATSLSDLLEAKANFLCFHVFVTRHIAHLMEAECWHCNYFQHADLMVYRLSKQDKAVLGQVKTLLAVN
jgi:hypothetical protein